MFTFGIFLSGTFHLNWNVWSGGFILDINYLSIFTDKLSYFQLYSRVGGVSSIGGEFISVRAWAWRGRVSHGGLLLPQREADALLAAGAARHGHGVLVAGLLQARP